MVYSAPYQVLGQSTQIYNWSYMNANPQGTNFSPQNQLGESNVGQLGVKWVFPIPSAPSVPGLNITGEGAIAPPIVVNGIVYLLTNYATIYAIDATTGDLIWNYQATLNRSKLPLGYLVGHMHGINYYDGDVWISLPDCSVVALDATNGVVRETISDICAGIPGNSGVYVTHGTAPVFYRDVMIVGSSVSEGTDAGRGFVAAYNISNGELLWRWFVSPPAGGDQTWDETTCQYPCHGNVQPYPGDWGTMGYNGNHTLVGADISWGQFAVDLHTGVVYLGTGQPSPDWNATFRPGPNLYSDSIVALNITNGRMLWFFQTTPHDLYDFDCGWNVVLGNATVDGHQVEAVYKACKNGFVIALNAATGSLLWYYNPTSVVRLNTQNANYIQTGSYNATLPWVGYPSTSSYIQCPGDTGAVESDIALAYGKVFVATHNFCTYVEVSPVNKFGSNVWGESELLPLTQNANTTIYALDQSTGKVAWTFSIQGVPYRGWLTATGGMVFASSLDGNIYALDESTGRLVDVIHVGASLYEGITVGSDLEGNILVLQLVSSSNYYAGGGGVPGVLIAYGLTAPSQSTGGILYTLLITTVIVLSFSLAALAYRMLRTTPNSVK